jgi:hypothetical protein
MNYFISNLFRDWNWWAKIGLVFVATMNLVDILSAGFAWPGFFGLWVVRITVGAGVTGLLAHYFYQNRHDKKKRQLEILLPALAAERRAYFEKMTAADSRFQTFCFECCHYDANRRCCSLRLYGREVWVKLRPLEAANYCLYWNLRDHPIMSLTENLAPQRNPA